MVQFMSNINKLFLEIWVLKEEPWLHLHLLQGCPENSHRILHSSLCFPFVYPFPMKDHLLPCPKLFQFFFPTVILLYFWFFTSHEVGFLIIEPSLLQYS